MSILERNAPRHGDFVEPHIVAHYQLVAPLMEQIFGRIPIGWTTRNPHPGQRPIYHLKFFGHYSYLTSEHVQHLASIGALEFLSWCPLVDDPARARFARILLERQWDDSTAAPEDTVRRAAVIMKDLLETDGFSAIPVIDGVGGVSLFVPLADGPSYPDVRLWAHALARKAIDAHPEIFNEAPNVNADGRVHIHVRSNAQNLFSILPYSFRTGTRRIATPVTWDELATTDMLGTPLEDFRNRISTAGDVFSAMLANATARPLPNCHREASNDREPQRAAPSAVEALPMLAKSSTKRAPILNEATQILWDGKPRTAQELLTEGRAKGFFGPYTEEMLKSHLLDYINRTRGRGLQPSIVMDGDEKFRINEPLDLWPNTVSAPATPAVDVDKLIARLRKTSNDGTLSEQFEQTVCDAFTALGFLTTHVGGRAAPDGYADAPLGTMGYRVMIECKSGTPTAGNPNVYEAAKYKDAYKAQYCIMVGDGIGRSQREVIDEMRTHGVALWDVDDIASALQHRFTPAELEAAFSPGIMAGDKLIDLLWAREHGAAKRVRIIADIVRNAGWTTQRAAAQAGSPMDAPLLTEDAAMLLVDQELAAQGAHVNCTRGEVRLAFEWLTNPLNDAAVWNAEKTAIVVASPS